MRRQDFLNNFGGYYLMLEKKLMTTFNYVGLSTSNFSTFSNEYALLIQSIGAELDSFFKTPIQKSSPNANDSDDYLDKKVYGYSSKKKYMSVAFPPKIIDESIYGKEPIFWSGNALPSIITQKNLSYIVRFKACFNLKKGKEPFVMNKTSFLYPFNKALTTSDIYDSKSKKYYSQYLDKNGNIVKSKPTLILTSDDFKLFQELYIVKDLEILDGCYFL